MKFTVWIDVTMSGRVEIDAANEEKARQKVKGMCFTSQDLRTFAWNGNDVYDIEVSEED